MVTGAAAAAAAVGSGVLLWFMAAFVDACPAHRSLKTGPLAAAAAVVAMEIICMDEELLC